VSSPSSAIDLPAPLLAWVEETCEGRVARAARHFAGASREAWSLDVDSKHAEDPPRPLFLLRDRGPGQGSARDAAVLRALAETPIPVPRVVAYEPRESLLLLERLAGRSDFPSVDREAERAPTARHLMELTGRLHELDIDDLEIAHLAIPESPEDCARPAIAQARSALTTLGDSADPFFEFALSWLESNLPTQVSRYSLVHSDMGPGNFLFEGGRVTGIVDWEVAHYGDPMEDLAAIAVRDMATPVGDLSTRLDEYAQSCAIPVVPARVHYYRALVLVRNSLMIGLGLLDPAPGLDVVEMTMYQTLLMRAAALVLCDNLGVARPTRDSALPALDGEGAGGDRPRQVFLAALRRELEDGVVPALEGGPLERRSASLRAGLATIEHEARVGAALDARECEDLAGLLDRAASSSAHDLRDLESALRQQLAGPARSDDLLEQRACYFARRLHRLAERRRPLMGALYERLPQPLEGRRGPGQEET